MNYSMQTHRSTDLTLREMLIGQPMPAPQLRGPFTGPPLEQLQTELKVYMRQLTAIHRTNYLQEKAREASLEQEVEKPVMKRLGVHQGVPEKVARATSGRTSWSEPHQLQFRLKGVPRRII